MSQPDLEPTRSMVVQKPKSNVYTVLLGIAALALAVGCVAMLLEIVNYSGSFGFSSLYDAIRGPSN
ncbi:hypothetical protein [Aeoliella mucimassa]|uniref:Uncharacterized protein n=1 Tax=Aeoliella mucimassa TaxID=2527972 RepID=A0A518AH08_9BACT|nr:hypothetical protein [Aeoliella mucimassa]QDU53984.1 hypothetical protein Pan181_01630 [Aeoliella mucimassa]